MATSPETAGVHQVVEEEPYYNVSLPWQKSYQNFERWLKSVDLYELARLLPGADITHAILEYFPEGLGEADYRASRKGGEYMGEGPGRLKITDPNELELCLRNYQGQYAPGPLYRVAFKLRNGSLISGLLTPATVPAFVKQHFGG